MIEFLEFKIDKNVYNHIWFSTYSTTFEYFVIYIFILILKALLIIIPVLLAVAYLTLGERKVLGAMQKRKGPNVVGIWGLLQALADGLKLLLKEMVFPSVANKFLFIFHLFLLFY